MTGINRQRMHKDMSQKVQLIEVLCSYLPYPVCEQLAIVSSNTIMLVYEHMFFKGLRPFSQRCEQTHFKLCYPTVSLYRSNSPSVNFLPLRSEKDLKTNFSPNKICHLESNPWSTPEIVLTVSSRKLFNSLAFNKVLVWSNLKACLIG